MRECRPLKIGLYIPHGDGPANGGNARWRDVLRLARHAEAAGFDSLWLADHLLFRFPNQPAQGRWECWTLLAALAAATERIALGTLVSCLGFRNPALLAKIAATTDEIAGGRLILGLGAGWHEPEYAAFGYPFDHRVGRFADGLAIVHGLLRAGRADLDGRYLTAAGAELRPPGPRLGKIPILVGSNGERMLGLTARYADLWNANWTRSPDEIPPLRRTVDAACAAANRDPATLGRTASVLIDLPGRVGRGFGDDYAHPAPLSPAAIAAMVRGYADEGISHVMLWLDPSSPAGIDAFKPALALLDRDG